MPAPDPVALVRRLMRGDRFAAASGAVLAEVREGYARTTMRLRPEHMNGVGVVQGGAIFTLADFAFAAASNSHGTVAVALDVSITFARAATKGVLTAEAVEEAFSRRVSVCNVRVTDGEGRAVAFFRGTAFRKDEAPGAPAPGPDRRTAGGLRPPRRPSAGPPGGGARGAARARQRRGTRHSGRPR